MCVCVYVNMCVLGGGEWCVSVCVCGGGGYATQTESRALRCGAKWLGSYCHFTCTAGVACQLGVCVSNLSIYLDRVSPHFRFIALSSRNWNISYAKRRGNILC